MRNVAEAIKHLVDGAIAASCNDRIKSLVDGGSRQKPSFTCIGCGSAMAVARQPIHNLFERLCFLAAGGRIKNDTDAHTGFLSKKFYCVHSYKKKTGMRYAFRFQFKKM